MTFKEAAEFKMPFGKWRGKTLDGIASTDAGLKYLDWLRGERESNGIQTDVDLAVSAYLDDPSIRKELER